MDEPVPPILASRSDQSRETGWGRLLALGIAIACVAVLIRAATLVPSPTGMGTHRTMGLANCGFLERTGIPCPSCGMTTSFAWFVRGNLLASFYVQPMGALLAFAAGVTTWGAAYIVITGRPIHRLLRLLPGRYYLLPILLFACLAWGWKILIHLNKWDGWG
jgi:hypothetical protein